MRKSVLYILLKKIECVISNDTQQKRIYYLFLYYKVEKYFLIDYAN